MTLDTIYVQMTTFLNSMFNAYQSFGWVSNGTSNLTYPKMIDLYLSEPAPGTDFLISENGHTITSVGQAKTLELSLN